MNFRVGQKVVCVDAKVRHPRYGETGLVEGAVYTVRGFNGDYHDEGIAILLEEVRDSCRALRPNGQERGYYPWRFRPIVERKTDISIFMKMLDGTRRPARTNQLGD